jgi:hypothetical protein
MTMSAPEPPFPCPFCHSPRVRLVGGGLVFLHYRCGECAEVWTAMVRVRTANHPALRHDVAEPPAQHAGGAEWAEEPEDPADWITAGHLADGGARRGKFWRH